MSSTTGKTQASARIDTGEVRLDTEPGMNQAKQEQAYQQLEIGSSGSGRVSTNGKGESTFEDLGEQRGTISQQPSMENQQSIVGSIQSSTGGNPTGGDNDVCHIPGEGYTSVGAAKVRGFLQPDGNGGLQDAQGAKEQAQEIQQTQQDLAQEQAEAEQQELQELLQAYDSGEEARQVVTTLYQNLGERDTDAVIAHAVSCVANQQEPASWLEQYSQKLGMEADDLFEYANVGVQGLTSAAGDYLSDQHNIDADDFFQAVQDKKLDQGRLTSALLSMVYTGDPRAFDDIAQVYQKKKAKGEI